MTKERRLLQVAECYLRQLIYVWYINIKANKGSHVAKNAFSKYVYSISERIFIML
jgi:hypothetical protein